MRSTLCRSLPDTWISVGSAPSVVHVNTQQSGKITVVGDLHGQLRDLIHIFRHNGMPSFDNPYLFNGDIADRITRLNSTVLFALPWPTPVLSILTEGTTRT